MENEEKVDLLLKTTLAKCGCKRSMCKNNQCSCVKRGLRCSVLCTCINCDYTNDNSRPGVSKASIDNETEDHDEYQESGDESSDNYTSDEDDNDLYFEEQDTYSCTVDTVNNHSDEEDITLM